MLLGPVEMDSVNRASDAQRPGWLAGWWVCPTVMHLIGKGDTSLAPFELL